MDLHSLATELEARKTHLRAVAGRILGSASEAEDALQEAWLKLASADTSAVKNVGGWMTTVVARVCLDMLRSRKSRREDELSEGTEVVSDEATDADLTMVDALGPSVLVVMDALAPAERVAFVLHDVFDMPFEDIAPIVARTLDATRQLASRARRKVRDASVPEATRDERRELVDAFLTASRAGDLARLLSLLSPEAVLRADAMAVRVAAEHVGRGAPVLVPEARSAEVVANALAGRARGALLATIDGAPGAVWAVAGQVRSAFVFTIEEGKIAAIELVMEPSRLADLAIRIG